MDPSKEKTVQNQASALNIYINSSASSNKIIKRLTKAAINKKHLQILTIQNYSHISDHIETIVQLIQKNPSIWFISLTNCALSDAAFEQLVNALKNLKELKSVTLNNTNLTPRVTELLCQLAQKHELKDLILDNNKLDSACIQKLFEIKSYWRNLKTLSLSGNLLQAQGVEYLLNWLTPKAENSVASAENKLSLSHLYLKNVGMTTVNIVQLANLLLNKVCSLKVIDIRDIETTDEEEFMNAIAKLMQALISFSNLIRLSMPPKAFEYPAIETILYDKKLNSLAIRNMRSEAYQYYWAKAEAAILDCIPATALIHYQNCLKLKSESVEASEALDNARLFQLRLKIDELDESYVITVKDQIYKDICKFFEEIKQRWINLEKDAGSVVSFEDESLKLKELTKELQLLIQDNIPYTAETKHIHPIFNAIEKRDKKTIKLWAVSYGYNLKIPDTLGNTPLHYAAVKGKNDILDLLISLGARANYKNAEGIYPYQMVIDDDELARNLRLLQNKHLSQDEPKVIRLFKRLVSAMPIDPESFEKIKAKFKDIQHTLKLLEQIYARALEKNLIYEAELKQLYNRYHEVYNPLIYDPAIKPSCYLEGIDSLVEEENHLIKLCSKLTPFKDNADKERVGFYNEICKLIADLKLLKEQPQEILIAAHKFYTINFLNKEVKMEQPTSIIDAKKSKRISVINLSKTQQIDLYGLRSSGRRGTLKKNAALEEFKDCIDQIQELLNDAEFQNRLAIDPVYSKTLFAWNKTIEEQKKLSDKFIISAQQNKKLASYQDFRKWLQERKNELMPSLKISN